jgi:hypothetical protein
MDGQDPPLFLRNEIQRTILQEVIECIPKNSELYLHGGAVRNAVFYRLFGEELPQRDFDMLLIGDKDLFTNILLSRGFVRGKKNIETGATFKKQRHHNPSEDFDDWVYLDVVFRTNMTVEESLQKKVNFTINGSAINANDIFAPNWFEKVIMLPDTLEDLKLRRIRVNRRYAINIYACVRFVSLGFAAPSQKELADMIEDLRSIDQIKFARDTAKVIQYVGSAEKVREIVRRLGIAVDILDFDSATATTPDTTTLKT